MKIILSLTVIVLSILTTVCGECGYSVCRKTDPKKLNIHLVPNSHDDVGWTQTPDRYFVLAVTKIITNVIQSLLKSPDRRFTQVETYYFHRYWREANEQTREVLRKLISTGRMVLINGGWTVNDEGVAHYNNIIDQMTLGLRFLKDTFGKCGQPKISWQVDPFGASSEMASLYAQMGFDAHIVQRGVPRQEFIWKGSPDINTKIFTTPLHSWYGAPDGFNFENGTYAINDSNSAQKADQFVDIARKYNKQYGYTNQVSMPMGADFTYVYSERWYSNMDKLIQAIKARHTDVDIFYSTPDCYVYSLNSLNKTFIEKDVDYLHDWTGYYANRPSLKLQDRMTNNILQASKQLDVVARLDSQKTSPYLEEARNQVAVLTHHDAITGTSPMYAIDDFAERLQSAYSASEKVFQKAMFYIKNKQKSYSSEIFCDSLNISECSPTESDDKIAVTLYNPIAKPVSRMVRIPVTSGEYEVYDSKQQKVVQKSLLEISDAVKHLPERRSKATHELTFKVQLPALGFTTYFVEKIHTLKKRSLAQVVRHKRDQATLVLKGKTFTLNIDEKGALTSITTNGKTHKFKQSFEWYKSRAEVKGLEDSGSYQFCPDGEANNFGEPKLLSRQSSNGVHELHQQFSDYIKQTVRTYEDEDYIEFDWTVGPIPIGDKVGKEIITRFETDFKTNNIFYTDANGRQTIKRHFDPNLKLCQNSIISGNWYPIYSRIAIKDETDGLEMTVLTDRTQGGSSLKEGELELMVHRRLTHKGLGGPFIIDNPGVDGKGIIVRGKHYLFLKPISQSAQLVKPMAESLFMAPVLLFDKYTSIKDYSSQRDLTFSALSHSLPESVHLLTLENWKPNQVLIRLEHMFETSDNSPLSKAVDVDLENLFKTLKIKDLVETNLVANELLSETKRLNWNSKYYSDESYRSKRAVDMKITLKPQQIRTFILTVEDNTHKEAKCTHNWVKTTKNAIPSDAYIGGRDVNGNPLNICRNTVNGVLFSGKADKQLGCVVTNAGKVFSNETFEVLEAKNVEWVPRHGSDPIPENAIIVGNKTNGNTYIGRCFLHNSEVIGKIDYDFHYAFDNKEWIDCHNHEVLVCV